MEVEFVILKEEVKDSNECEMLMNISDRATPMGNLSVLYGLDSFDVGSFGECKESHGLYDHGDLANNADQQPGHLFIY